MANKAAAITQADAKRLFKAGIDAGFGEVKIVLHPDGRVEACASVTDTPSNFKDKNSWDDVLR